MPATLRAARHRDLELLAALGRVIKAARRARRMKGEHLAECLGTSQQTVSLWETGKTAITLPHLYAVAAILEVPASTLLRHAERVTAASQIMHADSARLAEPDDDT